MKVYIVTEADLERLRDRLELANFRNKDHSTSPAEKAAFEDMWRAYHYIAEVWIDSIKEDKST